MMKMESLGSRAYNELNDLKKELEINSKSNLITDKYFEDYYFGLGQSDPIKTYNFTSNEDRLIRLNISSEFSSNESFSLKIVLNNQTICYRTFTNVNMLNFDLNLLTEKSNTLKIYYIYSGLNYYRFNISLSGNFKFLNKSKIFIDENSAGNIAMAVESGDGYYFQTFSSKSNIINNVSLVNVKNKNKIYDSRYLCFNKNSVLEEFHLILLKDSNSLILQSSEDSYANHTIYTSTFSDACLIPIKSDNYAFLIGLIVGGSFKVLYIDENYNVVKNENISIGSNLILKSLALAYGKYANYNVICLCFLDEQNNAYFIASKDYNSNLTSLAFNSDLTYLGKAYEVNCFLKTNELNVVLKNHNNKIDLIQYYITSNSGKILRKVSSTKYVNIDMVYVLTDGNLIYKNGMFF